MDWKAPFVIFRISGDGKIEQVHMAEDLKAAKYWLTYIAQAGDVLCKTPVHPKHSRAGSKPEYWCHKEPNCGPVTNYDKWLRIAEQKSCKADFPENQTE